jgi:hypothetical protein
MCSICVTVITSHVPTAQVYSFKIRIYKHKIRNDSSGPLTSCVTLMSYLTFLCLCFLILKSVVIIIIPPVSQNEISICSVLNTKGSYVTGSFMVTIISHHIFLFFFCGFSIHTFSGLVLDPCNFIVISFLAFWFCLQIKSCTIKPH